MKPLSLTTLAILATVGLAAGVAVTQTQKMGAYSYWYISPLLAAMFLLVAAVLGGFGWQVRQSERSKRTRVDPLVAFNTAVFANSIAWTGAGAAGFLVGMAIPLVTELSVSYASLTFWCDLANAAAAVVMMIVAVVVERWCQIDDDDTDVSGKPTKNLS
ncbi:DUF3180 domain-containing protein [Gleimia hominis]|uniref:DUF3180 domain-containing protein n=1 Tax=Gleimia hominis TaxID=595468 RepID=UPI000C801283|nr:DUF3180 domain-containing protein [Gleimia hominis]WIK64500.1 DUF3180 domain-containing protein [Gleimia hominis]